MQNLLYLLPLLACPLGMGLMMWMMARMMGGKKDKSMQEMQVRAGEAANQPPTPVNPADRLTSLQAELDDVQGQIARLATEDRSAASPSGAPLVSALSGRGTDGLGGR